MTNHMVSEKYAILGEVLWDVFPEGAVLGGAPFNVACHLRGLGVAPLLISAIGADDFGRGVLDHMRNWGMSTEGIAVVKDKPTGQVSITFEASGDTSVHQFTILADQAYDAISSAQVAPLMQTNGLSMRYFGSLCLRSKAVREACECLLAASNAPVFVDINLRAPWYQADVLQFALQSATILKLNVDELAELIGLFGLPSASLHSGQLSQAYEIPVRWMMEQFSIAHVILTDGAHGAHWWNKHETFSTPSNANVIPIVDTVGAGDAFSAVCMIGLRRGWEISTILQRAQNLAENICQIRGAIPSSLNFYDTFRRDWE